jgi:hypothetical protein
MLVEKMYGDFKNLNDTYLMRRPADMQGALMVGPRKIIFQRLTGKNAFAKINSSHNIS